MRKRDAQGRLCVQVGARPDGRSVNRHVNAPELLPSSRAAALSLIPSFGIVGPPGS